MEPQLSRRHSACDRPIRIIRSEHAIGRRLSSDSFRPWVDSRVFPQPARTETRVRENGTAAITTIVDAVNMDVVEAGEACEMLGLETSRLAELDLIARKQKRDQSFMA